MKAMKGVFHTAICLLFVGGLFVGGAVSAQADIQIGVAGPMSGPSAAFGEQLRHGGDQAVADINARGGVLGQKLVLTIGDDACDPKQAVSVANSLVSKGVIFVAGHYCSSASIPASEVYAEAGVLMITPASTNPALTEEAAAKGWNNVYRTCGRDDQQGKLGADYLLGHFKGRPIAVIDDRSTYGKGLADQVRLNLQKSGQPEAIDEQITVGEKDFSALISKLKHANIAVMYFGGYQTEAGLIVRQARDQGLQAQFVAGDALAAHDFWQITGPAGEGTVFSFPNDPRSLPSAQPVLKALKAKNEEAEGFTLYNYAAIQVFAEAAEKAHSLKLADLAKTLHGTSFDTVIGRIKYDEKGDLQPNSFVLWQWKNGDFNPIPK